VRKRIPRDAGKSEVPARDGAPLDATTRSFFEARFGAGLDRVRIHTSPWASQVVRRHDARAVTVGRDLYFDETSYRPDTEDGRGLLAHELAHSLQQGLRPAPPPDGLPVSHPGDPAEREAHAAARSVLAGARPSLNVALAAPVVHRAPKLLSPDEVKKQIKAVGWAEINEMVDTFPGALWDDKAHVVKAVDKSGVRHEWTITMHMIVGGKGGAVTIPLPSVEQKTGDKVTKVTHPIDITINQDMSPFVEAVFHELVHARLEVDRGLPEGDRSDTFKRYTQMQQLATDPALLAVTKTTKKAEALKNALGRMTTWFKMFVDESVVSAPKFKTDELYDFLIEEKFVGQAAAGAFKHTRSNKDTATIYGETIFNDLKRAAQNKGFFSKFQAAYENDNQRGLVDTAMSDTIQAAQDVYGALDAQKQDIEAAKGSPDAKPPPQPLPELMPGFKTGGDIPASPVDLQGKPVP